MTEDLKTEPELTPGDTTDGTSPLAGGDDADDEFSRTMVIETPPAVETAPDKRLQAGSVLRDRYLLHDSVAAGSMGVVYKAFDRHLADVDGSDAAVAIKVLSPQLSGNPDALRALQQEAAKGRCLNHPHIVRFIDLDREDDLYFLVMEWLEGESLANALDSGNLKADIPRALEIVKQIGGALDFAHRCGVIHADVKPGNIMLLPDGSVKLVDFGIARVQQRRRGANASNPDVLRAATPAYSSMQVLTGDEPNAADDVFSLACLAYRLIAGHRVFGPRNAAEAAEAGMDPQRPQGLTDSQWKALRKGLAYSRVARQRSPLEFVNELMAQNSAVDFSPAEELRIPADAFVERRFNTSRTRWPYAVLLALIAAGLGLAARPDWRATVLDWLPPAVKLQLAAAPEPSPQLPVAVDVPVQASTQTREPAVTDDTGSRTDPVAGAASETNNADLSGRNTDAERSAADSSAQVSPVDIESVDRSAEMDQAVVTDDPTENIADEAPTLASADGNSLVLAAPGESSDALVLNIAEDGGDVVLLLYRWFGLSEALLVRIDEVGFSGSRSPLEDGEFSMSGDGIVNFDPGQRQASITIRPTPDDLRESDRQVNLLLRDYYNPESTLGRVELRLLDDDQRRYEEAYAVNTVAFATSSVVVSERDPAALIDVERFNPDQSSLSIRYDIRDITATEGEDYFMPGRRFVTFGPGQRSARLLIPLVQDTVTEDNESFAIELGQGGPASSAISRVVVTIQDDDSLLK
ncbi:MAG: protein kinase [Woeseia sp.]